MSTRQLGSLWIIRLVMGALSKHKANVHISTVSWRCFVSKKTVLCCLAAWSLFLMTSLAGAGQVPNLTAPEVKKMVEEDGALLIHVLSQIEFEIQHIPNSINIPITQVANSDKLPSQLDKPLIFYCMGER